MSSHNMVNDLNLTIPSLSPDRACAGTGPCNDGVSPVDHTDEFRRANLPDESSERNLGTSHHRPSRSPDAGQAVTIGTRSGVVLCPMGGLVRQRDDEMNILGNSEPNFSPVPTPRQKRGGVVKILKILARLKREF